ncbi:MAG: hypothetical protein OXU20_42015 [Myxococcales bacterium]|nr:hypothetical protein [Myxococcales bacterium]
MHEQQARTELLRGGAIAAVVLVAVVLTWVVTGRGGHGGEDTASARLPAPAAQQAPTYSELREHSRIGSRQEEAFLRLSVAESAEAKVVRQEAAAVATRARRAALRAFPGAPPRVPHPVDQAGFPSCPACHDQGLRLGTRSASAMSHQGMSSCLQCHVVAHSPLPFDAAEGSPPLDNGFVGVAAAGLGSRAWAGAPPSVPHPTHMRERCLSCHGQVLSGIGTTHPSRRSCLQCHAPTAAWDQQPLARIEDSP